MRAERDLFRDKLAMRTEAQRLGIRVPEFTSIIWHDDVRHFLANVPAPWLLKPRSQASAMGIQRLQHPEEVWRAIERLGDDQSFHLLERHGAGRIVPCRCADGRQSRRVRRGEPVRQAAFGHLPGRWRVHDTDPACAIGPKWPRCGPKTKSC